MQSTAMEVSGDENVPANKILFANQNRFRDQFSESRPDASPGATCDSLVSSHSTQVGGEELRCSSVPTANGPSNTPTVAAAISSDSSGSWPYSPKVVGEVRPLSAAATPPPRHDAAIFKLARKDSAGRCVRMHPSRPTTAPLFGTTDTTPPNGFRRNRFVLPAKIITDSPAEVSPNLSPSGFSPNLSPSGLASAVSPLRNGSPQADPIMVLSADEKGCLKRRRPGLRPNLFLNTDCGSGELLLEPSTQNGLDGDRPATEILDYLYIGGLEQMQQYPGFIHDNSFNAFINASRKVTELPKDSKELRLFLRDIGSENICLTFYPAIEFIESCRKEGRKVLVYCKRGVSRSATIVIAYLMWLQNLSYQDAVGHVRAKRPSVNPNPGFSFQLGEWASARPSLAKNPCLVYQIIRSDSRTVLCGCNGEPETLPLALGPLPRVSPSLFTSPVTGEECKCWLVCCPSLGVQFIWFSVGIQQSVLDDALSVARQLSLLEDAPENVVPVQQGSEPADFWNVFATVASSSNLAAMTPVLSTRTSQACSF